MEPYIGQLAIFGFNYAPKGWAFCNGQLLPIAQYSALFTLLGITYGGDGIVTFALPNLQSRVPIHFGQGPGLSNYVLGQESGTEETTILISNMPTHSHHLVGSADAPNQDSAGGASLASNSRGGEMPPIYAAGANNQVAMASSTTMAGGNLPISILQPYLALNFCIALEGIFPSKG